MNVVGKLMEAAAWLVRTITFDAHMAHSWFREAMFGHLETLKLSEMQAAPFFGKLEHRPLPKHAFPHFPVQLAFYDGLPVAAIPGLCFLGVTVTNKMFLFLLEAMRDS